MLTEEQTTTERKSQVWPVTDNGLKTNEHLTKKERPTYKPTNLPTHNYGGNF